MALIAAHLNAGIILVLYVHTVKECHHQNDSCINLRWAVMSAVIGIYNIALPPSSPTLLPIPNKPYCFCGR